MELELPHPDVLWTRLDTMDGDWGNLGRADYVRSRPDSRTVAGRDRWAIDDGGSNWFALIRLSDGRAVLFGRDAESSVVAVSGYDPWMGVPAWVLAVDRTIDNPRIDAGRVTFVRWWDAGQWQRVHYEPRLDDGLYLTLRHISDPWFPAGEPVMDRAAAIAAARGFEPSEPQMQYRKLTDPAARLIEPVHTFVEIDSDGYEARKVEYFPGGGVGFAGGMTETGTTQLWDEDPAEPLELITERTGFVAVEISAEAFQVEWLLATGWN